MPMNSNRLKAEDLNYLVVMMAKSGPIVMMTHSPCISQAQKNLILVFLISMNLLSMLVLLILKNRKEPSLPAHINTINPATVCFKFICSLVSEAMKVIEMKVMLPVKSQYFSVLQMMAGMDAITCKSKEYAVRKQTIGTEQIYRDLPAREQAKSEERESTTIGVMSFFIDINMIGSLIEIQAIVQLWHLKRQQIYHQMISQVVALMNGKLTPL